MANIQVAIPVLHVANVARSVDFYTSKLGFTLGFANGIGPGLADPCYCGLSRDGVWMHLSSHSGDRQSPAAALFVVKDVDALHTEVAAKGAPVDANHPVDQTWGTRETFFRDPDGYAVCFQQREFKGKES